MSRASTEWTKWAQKLTGPHFAYFQTQLTKYNAVRFEPSLPEDAAARQLVREAHVAQAEIGFVESLRKAIAPQTADIPSDVDGFIAWFEQLKLKGPGSTRSSVLPGPLTIPLWSRCETSNVAFFALTFLPPQSISIGPFATTKSSP